MARLTSSSATKKEGIVHPLSMHDVHFHPLNNSNSFADNVDSTSNPHNLEVTHRSADADAAVAPASSAEDNTVLVASVDLKDKAYPSNDAEEKVQKPQQAIDPSAQIIHPPSSTFAAKHKQLSQLPRSVRWRLSLGLLTDPFEGDKLKEDDVSSTSGSKRGSGGKPTREDKIIPTATSKLKSIEEVNALKLRFQRSRYEELEKRHYWSHSPVGIAGNPDSTQQDTNNEANTTTQHVAKGDDPLSALLDNNPEDKVPLFGFGAKRRGKRGTSINNNSIHSTSTKSTAKSYHPSEKESHPIHRHSTKEGEEQSETSKWAGFYSTREMLDVIEKDLNRLPTDHYTVYHSWRKRCVQVREERIDKEEKKRKDEEDERDSSNRSFNRPLRHRFANTGLGQSLNLGRDKRFGITFDDNQEEDDAKKAKMAEKLEIETSTKERAQKLSQILFVYGKEHEDIGYRQGMHEILSYILLVLEMDLMEHDVVKERNKASVDPLTSLDEPADAVSGGMAGVDSSGNIVVVRLQDPDYILHDAFTIFECLMDTLASAYDIQEGGDGASAGCLEAMTSSIVSKIRYIARDEALFSHVLYMPVPPQLYFAKWVRLMFSREVAGGMDAVMRLWDAFFELASATASMDDGISLSNALMNVLKTAAAAMILLIRHLLLAPTIAWDGSLTGDPDPNDGIQYLMNYPPIEDTGVFVKSVTSLLAKEKLLCKSDESKKLVKSHRYQRVSSDTPIVSIDYLHKVEDNKADTISRSSSNSNFMGWPASEGNELDVSFTIPTFPEVSISRRSSDVGHTVAQNDAAHDNKLEMNISGTLGNFASGLLGIGTKSVDVTTNSTNQEQLSGRSKSFTRLSFSGLRGLADNNATHRSNDVHHDDEEDPNDIHVTHVDLNDKERKGRIASLRRRSMSTESQISADDLNTSFSSHSSRMSASRSLLETCRHDPTVLANKLERSVATLMKHFDEQMRAEADTPPPTNGHSPVSHQRMMIPEDIWHAMADIEQVRKDLLSQSATEKLERSPSSFH